MRHFILTSTAFTGSIEYKYCDEGFLIQFHYKAQLSAAQREKILVKMPLTIAGFEDLVSLGKTLKVEEVMLDLSFDSFWNKYDKKINKKRCEPLWKKMSDAERLQCIKSISQYKNYLFRTGYNRGQKDPENYLRDKIYEADFKTLK